jgi:hypothetical protein
MSKTRDTGYLANVIQVHDTGVRIMSGSTMLMAISSSGAVTVTGVISGSNALSSSFSLNSALLSGTGSVGFTTTGSFLAVSSSQQQISASLLQVSASYVSLSGSYTTFSGSVSTRTTQIEQVYATTGSNSFRATQSITGSLTVTGQIVAQTLNVQQVTSSIIFSTGSNTFGCDLGNRQTFTGSVIMTGSLIVNTTGPELQVTNNGVILGNLLTDNHSITGSLRITGSVTATIFSGSGANLTSIPNAALSNSTISGISLGSNLATLTIGTGLSGTSYNGSTGITIANSGVTSIVAGTNISISGGTGAVTITNGVTNNNQLTNGAGYITSAGNAATATTATTANRVLFVSEANLNTAFTNTPAGQLSWTEAYNQTNAPTANVYYNTISMRHENANNVYGNQLAIRWVDSEPNTYVRVVNNNVFGTWRTILADFNYNSYAPTLTGTGASGTWAISITGNAASVPWSGVNAGYRENYDLGFRPPNNDGTYAGFRFGSPGNDGNAGYFLIRGGADTDVYTQNGITLVADLGWLTLAQRTTSGKGVRIMTGTTSTTRMEITTAGATSIYGSLNVVNTGTVMTMGEQGSNAKQLLFGIDSSNGTSELQSVWQNNSYTRLNLNPVAGAVFAGATRLDTLSDERVKDNIQPIAGALDKVLSITGKKFHLKDEEEGKIRYGFIAQELEGVLDEFVLQTNMTFKKEDLEVENVKSIDNWASSWSALLVEAIKEQQCKISTLESCLGIA